MTSKLSDSILMDLNQLIAHWKMPYERTVWFRNADDELRRTRRKASHIMQDRQVLARLREVRNAIKRETALNIVSVPLHPANLSETVNEVIAELLIVVRKVADATQRSDFHELR